MMELKKIFGIVTYFVNTTFGIAPPVVSEWMNIAANGADSEVELTRSHTLNELPMKVDVQIRVQHESTYYYFNAQSSAQSGSYNTEYGGVIYMFDESNVRIIAPGPSNCPSCNGYVLLLGDSNSIGPPNMPKKFKTGEVRFRAWRMCTFGKPSLVRSLLIDNVYGTQGEIPHGLLDLDLLIVHVRLQNSSYLVHGEDLAQVLTTTQPFGGIMFAFNNKNIRYWAPKGGSGTNEANGVPFAAVNGWGISGSGEISFSSNVTATLFGYFFGDFEVGPKEFSISVFKGQGTQDLNEVATPGYLNTDDLLPILTMKPEYDTGDAFGYKFYVPGSTSLNSTSHYNGLVYGVSRNSVYLWRPPGCMIVLGGMWGDGTMNDCSRRVEVTAMGISLNHSESVCGEFGCSATRIGPMCDCGASGMEGQFCGSVVQCMPPTDFNTAIVGYHGTEFSFNSTLQFYCKPGYVKSNGSDERRCSHTKTWIGDPLVCEKISCGPPDLIPDSGSYIDIVTSEKYQGTASYKCENGYGVASGNIERTCLATGIWGGEPPVCNVSCGAPVKNGTQRTNNQYCNTVGCYANFICAVGYENFVGDTSRYCEMDGNWTGIEPSCEIKYCPVPQTGSNSQLDFTTTYYQSNAQYICDEGYVSSSDQKSTTLMSTCQDDKTWNIQPLECQRVECPYPEPGFLVQAVAVMTYYYGDIITQQCFHGYMLANGSLGRTCQANKTWSGEKPNCKDIACPSLGNITKGYVITTGYVFGRQAVAICREGTAVMTGDMVRTCSLNGTWVGPTNAEPVCEDVYQVFRVVNPNVTTSNYTYDSNHLAVNLKGLSRYKRSKRSVFYNTPSHIALGVVGILVIIAVSLYICSLDTIRVSQQIKEILLKKKPKLEEPNQKKVYKVYVVRK